MVVQTERGGKRERERLDGTDGQSCKCYALCCYMIWCVLWCVNVSDHSVCGERAISQVERLGMLCTVSSRYLSSRVCCVCARRVMCTSWEREHDVGLRLWGESGDVGHNRTCM